MKRIFIISALLVSVVSCGGSHEATMVQTGGAIDPCRLVTPNEAATTIGEQVGDAKSENNNPDLTCSYTNSITGHGVSITIHKGRRAKNEFKQLQSIIAVDKRVDDLGDGAFISKLREIHALAGDTYFAIKINDASPLALPAEVPESKGRTELPQATRDKLTVLAGKVIERL